MQGRVDSPTRRVVSTVAAETGRPGPDAELRSAGPWGLEPEGGGSVVGQAEVTVGAAIQPVSEDTLVPSIRPCGLCPDG